MASLSKDDIAAIKALNPIEELAGRHGKLSRPNGRGICEGMCLCAPKRGKRPFWVNVGAQTFGCLAHGSACGGDVFAFLEKFEGLDFKSALARLGGAAVNTDPQVLRRLAAERAAADKERAARATAMAEDERRKAFEIWQCGVPAFGTLVDRYFEQRGLAPFRSKALRFQPDEAYWFLLDAEGAAPVILHSGPCLLAAIQAPDGKFLGLHRTWLDPRLGTEAMPAGAPGKAPLAAPDGSPLPSKKMRGLKQGGAIRLHDFHEGPGEKVFLCGEGIETVETAYQAVSRAFQKNYCAWAAADLGNLAGGGLGLSLPHPGKPGRFVPPDEPDPARPGVMPPKGTERAIILGDGDSDALATTAMIRRAQARWKAAGIETEIVMAAAGADFNDMAREAGDAPSTGAPRHLLPQGEKEA